MFQMAYNIHNSMLEKYKETIDFLFSLIFLAVDSQKADSKFYPTICLHSNSKILYLITILSGLRKNVSYTYLNRHRENLAQFSN